MDVLDKVEVDNLEDQILLAKKIDALLEGIQSDERIVVVIYLEILKPYKEKK